MNLSVPLEVNTGVKKHLFKLKPLRRDGLLLNIHHSKSNTKIRFVFCCFHETGQIIASADNDGHLYLVDFVSCKCWRLPKMDSCTFIKFSVYNQNDILCGRSNGDIDLIDLDSGIVTGKLLGHREPATSACFSQKTYCLSAAQNEAIIWDLQTNTKHRVLSLEVGATLRHAIFMPVSNNVLICFQDDLIQIWNTNTYELINQFLPVKLNNYCVKSITISRNGQTMIIAGYSPTLAIFLINKWKFSKLITLPESIHMVKSIDFVFHPYDGGANKILAILAGNGTIFFYDIEQNVIINQLTLKCEVVKFVCCPNGIYVACISCAGEVELYNLNQYVSSQQPADTLPDSLHLLSDEMTGERVRERIKSSRRHCQASFYKKPKDIGRIKEQIEHVLDSQKLKAILKEYGEYPNAYRTRIWEKLLRLPENVNEYNSIINHVTMLAFKDLYLKYPLESKISIQNLKKLLNNIVTWCPFFAHVDYLPVFVFPFVKVFHNKPVCCFEAVCTVLLNWCQYWFEYFPLPPVNILAMIENILLEHDPELLQHFSSNNVTANLYAWSLLESAFSEVLTAPEWLVLWDHVLTSEPSFLLCAVAAYNIVHRLTLLAMNQARDFQFFYYNQNPNDLKRFIHKAYHLLNRTNKEIHPGQYLEPFKGIKPGNYPLFVKFPQTVIDYQAEHIKGLKNELACMESYKHNLIVKAGLQSKDVDNAIIQEEESRRLKEMEKECLKKIEKEREKVKLKHQQLQCLRTILGEEEETVLGNVQKNLSARNQSRFHEYVMANISCSCVDKRNFSEAHAKLVSQFAEILKHKYRIKELRNKDTLPADIENEIMKKYRQKLDAEIDKVRKSLCSMENLKRLNLGTSIGVLENLIKSIEKELEQESAPKATSGNTKVKALQAETTGLTREVTNLMNIISDDSTKQGHGDGLDFKEGKEFCYKNVRFCNTA